MHETNLLHRPLFVPAVPPGIDHGPSAYQVVEGSGITLFCNATQEIQSLA